MLMLRYLRQHSGPHGTCASGKCSVDCGNISDNKCSKCPHGSSADLKFYSVARYTQALYYCGKNLQSGWQAMQLALPDGGAYNYKEERSLRRGAHSLQVILHPFLSMRSCGLDVRNHGNEDHWSVQLPAR